MRRYLKMVFNNMCCLVRLAGSLLCSVFSHGTPEEWEFGMQRLVNFPSNRSTSERIFLLKSLAGCSRDPDQYERYVVLLQ